MGSIQKLHVNDKQQKQPRKQLWYCLFSHMFTRQQT